MPYPHVDPHGDKEGDAGAGPLRGEVHCPGKKILVQPPAQRAFPTVVQVERALEHFLTHRAEAALRQGAFQVQEYGLAEQRGVAANQVGIDSILVAHDENRNRPFFPVRSGGRTGDQQEHKGNCNQGTRASVGHGVSCLSPYRCPTGTALRAV